MVFARMNIQREEDIYRLGASVKYKRIQEHLSKKYDPENAITLHFVLLASDQVHTHCETFPSLSGREVLYITGNHTVEPENVRKLTESFEMILAPSEHVLKPYRDAGLGSRFGGVVPHGIDPEIYSIKAQPFHYPTRKQFKFLQTSFPWIYEKGFDLTIRAFCRAFSCRDDVSLILRIPRMKEWKEHGTFYSQLEGLVKEALSNPKAPEILLIMEDVKPSHRGGLYTGADCYVHPLRAEGFGMTILEAMACGLPVIATSWSGPADFLSPRWAYTLRHSAPIPEKTSDGTVKRFHVEPELDHLIYFMRYCFEHQDEGKTIGQKAASLAHDRWTWEKAAFKLASLLNLSTSSTPPATRLSGHTRENL